MDNEVHSGPIPTVKLLFPFKDEEQGNYLDDDEYEPGEQGILF